MTAAVYRVIPRQAPQVRAELSQLRRSLDGGERLNTGDQGPAVTALQRMLRRAGVYEGELDGRFDLATRHAVQRFQQARGLAPSGAVGPETLRALRDNHLLVEDRFETPARRGQAGLDILQAERRLAALGYDTGKVDGRLDGRSVDALRAFQNDEMTQPNRDAAIDSQAWQRLQQVYQGQVAREGSTLRRRQVGSVQRHRLLDRATAQAARAGELQSGASGREVANLQRHLRAAGHDPGRINGEYRPRTTQAVRDFQRAQGLPDTGQVDGATWSRLRDRLFAASGAASPAQTPGEQGRAVRRSERLLDGLSYHVGKVDGRYDAATAAGVASFQRDHELKITGRLNARTLDKLEAAAQAGQIASVKQANRHFVTQWGPTRYNKTSASKYGYADCNPTASIMAASALGLVKHPSAAKASKAIDHMRDLQRGHNTSYSSGTSVAEMKRGLRAVGARVREIDGFAAIDRALERGHTLVAAGNPWQAWGQRLRGQGKYLNSKDPGNHAIAVLGRTPKGRYLVADPLASGGAIAVPRKLLARFLRDGSGDVVEVARRRQG